MSCEEIAVSCTSWAAMMCVGHRRVLYVLGGHDVGVVGDRTRR